VGSLSAPTAFLVDLIVCVALAAISPIRISPNRAPQTTSF
jgi:hypothetical protein